MRTVQILIVEDEFLIAEDLRQRLRQLHYEVLDSTGSGEEAIALAQALRPDLVLMDSRLQGTMDGFEAAQVIEQLVGCPIVYVTSNPRARAMPYSVPKPFTTPLLEAAITKALSTRNPI